MSNLNEYEIQFVGLKLGVHNFEYKIGKTFFGSFDGSEIESGDITVKLSLDRSDTMLVLDFNIEGYIDTLCDLCSDEIEIPVEGEYKQWVKFSEEATAENSEEVTILDAGEFKLNVAHYIFEFINLSVPVKHEHQKGECNDEVKNILNQYLLVEADESEDTEEIDPRWEALKSLKNKN